jgi:hypothetical protein
MSGPPTFGNPFDVAGGDEYRPPAVPAEGAWRAASPRPPPEASPLEDDEPFTVRQLSAPTSPAASPPPPPPPPVAFAATVGAREASGRLGAAPPPAARAAAPLLAHGAPRSAPLAAAPPPAAADDPASHPFYSVKRYRTHFDVDTADVGARLARAVAFFFRGDFLERLSGRPDLYGPFWVASTLVFVSAAAGNLASYFAFQQAAAAAAAGGGAAPAPADPSGAPAPPAAAWYYDVDRVGGSMALFYGYTAIVGAALWGVLKWAGAHVALPEALCLLGYSLAVFVPSAALCALPFEGARWALVGAATATSAVFLGLNLRAPLAEAGGARAAPVLLAAVLVQLALGLSIKLYFFDYSSASL